ITYVADPNSAVSTVTMPAQNVSLTANFQEEEESQIIYGDGVTDIDGNDYITVIIGNQEWMAENLRVARYNNEEDIPTNLNDGDWWTTTSGAYAIYDHNAWNTDGINSPEEMVAAYGKLYNWYAVDDSRGLCPEGWSVPSDADWTALVNYVVSQGFPNEWNNPNGAGNALKSCHQVNSPLGGECNTSTHPRWDEDVWSDYNHHGFDEFGFSALPGGNRWGSGSFYDVGHLGSWWSATEPSGTSAWNRGVYSNFGAVDRGNYSKRSGFSVRCLKDITEEPTLYNLHLEVHPEGAGSVFGESEYEEGELVNVTATANPGWEFVEWTGDITYIADPHSAGTTVTMPAQNVSLTANFQEEEEPVFFNLSLEVHPENAGSVTGAGEYQEGAEASITATANPGWEFVNWTGDITYVADPNSAVTTVTMPAQNVSITANFQEEEEDPEFTCGDNITFTYRGEEVTYGTIFRNGLCWLDRNLGADPMPFVPADDATGNTDTRLYGDLFQWGRLDDGHQDRTSSTTPGPVNQDVPGHGSFITVHSSPWDWRSPQNNALWQGEDGINNPCPPGWRVPTDAELEAERLSWGSNNAAGAFASPLKLPVAGYRLDSNGSLLGVGSYGGYWSSTVDGSLSRRLAFSFSGAATSSFYRAIGFSVRCLKD
ncbi:MAG: FISUMP domain-containing protein, partial [Bacteroidales bacterium]|nr:FISUMP domain-containing protein [Bacteroidales bacterium]